MGKILKRNVGIPSENNKGSKGETTRRKEGAGTRRKSGSGLWSGQSLAVRSLLVCVFVLVPSSILLLCHHRLRLRDPVVDITQAKIAVEPYQDFSLLEPYSIDYREVVRIREENMKKYDYDYSKFDIDRRSNLSLQEYRDVYDGKWPVLVTDVVPKWEASHWTKDYFNEHYGKERVAMKAVDGTLDNGVSLALPLELFYKHTQEAFPDKWTYVEDELFIPMRPELKRQIGDCVYLEEDYYQLFPDELRPWNAMLLWGTAYSRSSLHMDPYNWTGTNAVMSGRKRWLMYPPGQDHHMYIKGGKLSGFPLNCYKYNSPVDGMQPDLQKYSRYKNVHSILFDQLPGEMLFIPTGWYHQAYNVEETIAISSQVMNRNNYRVVLEEILKVDNLARSSLPVDIDDMDPPEQVKTVMSLLPQSIKDQGRRVTEDAIRQMKQMKSDLHHVF